MAITSVESSKYISQQQKYLSNIRIGQFAKFLNKNPMFVTYYPINNAESRTDAGTGAVHEDIGPRSPVRYNKIRQLPAFNIPELKPEVLNDEGGYDMEMDLNDITFIAGTIRPRPGDCMRIDIAGAPSLLYQCTAYRHNTIQSNDYYLGDYHLLDIDQDYIKLIENQVEQTFTCKFENIGTNQKILMTDEDESKAADAQELIDALTDFYNDAFYNAEVDGFVLRDGNPPYGTQWYVDNHLTRFINESEIFVNDNSDHTVVLPYLDILELNFDMNHKRTVWTAVLKRTADYMNRYTYAWNRFVQLRVSPLLLAGIPSIAPTLLVSDKHIYPQDPRPTDLDEIVAPPGSHCGWDGLDIDLRTYFSQALINSIMDNVTGSDLNMVERMIAQYINQGIKAVTYTKTELLEFAFTQNLFTYMHMPIIIYILKQHLASLNAVEG